MLMLFVFSIMPKKAFHDLLANHKDSLSVFNDSKAQQFSWSGFHCNCDNLVVESPFIDNYHPLELITPGFRWLKYAEPAAGCTVMHQFYFKLRGPPAILVS
jgi:hypothetical protein